MNLSEGGCIVCSLYMQLIPDAFQEKKTCISLFFSAIESLNMSFDEDKIGKVVMNLLSNAFKFTPGWRAGGCFS